MHKANVTAQLSKQELGGLSEKLMEIGKRNTGNLMDVPKTFNKTISAGFDVKTSLAALEPTLQAAKMAFSKMSQGLDQLKDSIDFTISLPACFYQSYLPKAHR